MTSALPKPTATSRVSSGEQAALFIRQQIFDGEFKPGERIPQDEVARSLGLSRIPLREALIALEREGWVTLRMHRGAFVNALDEQAVRDHYALFGMLYAFAVQKALERADDTLVDRLAEIETRFDAETDPVEAGAIVLTFHATMIDAAQSNRIKSLFRAISTVIPSGFFAYVPRAVDVEREILPNIVAAMRVGDAATAATEYQRMMDRIGDEVVNVLRLRGLFVAQSLDEVQT